jgi:hypothetical protein
MARFFSSLAALVFTFAATAQSGPTSTGFGEGSWNAGIFEQRTTGRVVLFPNPANDQVSVVLPGFTGPVIVTVLASDGRMVRREQLNQAAGQQLIADVADLPAGYYVVNVEQEGDRVAERLVVAH